MNLTKKQLVKSGFFLGIGVALAGAAISTLVGLSQVLLTGLLIKLSQQ